MTVESMIEELKRHTPRELINLERIKQDAKWGEQNWEVTMICMCTLAGSAACLTCSNNRTIVPMSDPSRMPVIVPRAKRIIEKFDENGKLFERIIEE
jgi:hypothetical protein